MACEGLLTGDGEMALPALDGPVGVVIDREEVGRRIAPVVQGLWFGCVGVVALATLDPERAERLVLGWTVELLCWRAPVEDADPERSLLAAPLNAATLAAPWARVATLFSACASTSKHKLENRESVHPSVSAVAVDVAPRAYAIPVPERALRTTDELSMARCLGTSSAYGRSGMASLYKVGMVLPAPVRRSRREWMT